MKLLVLCLMFVIGRATCGGVPGAPNQLTDADKLKYLLNKVKWHLETLSGKPNHSQLEYVGHSSATYQVVAGSLYVMNGTLKENDQEVNCLLKLWEKPWNNFEKFTAYCGVEPERKYESVVGEERRRKSATLLGGPQEVPEEEWPGLHIKVQRAFIQLGAEHQNFAFHYKNIIRATKQIVAGISYDVDVNVGVGEAMDETKECKVTIWEKSWENFVKATFKCENAKYEHISSPTTSTSNNK